MEWEDVPEYFATEEFELRKDHKTLWVNGLHGLLGRLKRTGQIDIHNQEGSCCHCDSQGSYTLSKFFDLVQQHHGLDIQSEINRQQ